MIRSLLDKVTTVTWNLALFIWNSAPVAWTSGLEFGLPPILDVVVWYWYLDYVLFR